MKIVTLTLNPAFDVHCFAENFKPYHESIVDITSKEAGGKGVNVSRALVSNGVDNLAVAIVGKDNGEEFVKALEKDGLTVAPVYTEGRIRENITLHEKENPETRISFNGFSCSAEILEQVKKSVGKVDKETIITFTGSIPKGIKVEQVLSLLDVFKKDGAKVVIDSRSVSLAQLTEFKPWLIKPNKDETENYTGKVINSVQDAAEIAKSIYNQGVENVVVSLGGDGAVLASDKGVFHAVTPKIEVVSTIGAGDSMIAGFIEATANGFSVERALVRAVAFGSSACMMQGTLPPSKENVEYLSEKITLASL